MRAKAARRRALHRWTRVAVIAGLACWLAVLGASAPAGAAWLAQRYTATPDPNSPLPTPTWTPTLFILPTDTPPVVLPTDTPPAILPTDTPPVVLPTDTPAPGVPPLDTPLPPPPALVPTATPPIMLPPPVAPLAVTPLPTATITGTLDILVVTPTPPGAGGPTAARPGKRTLDRALFVDNLVIAFGYVWRCLGWLLLLAVVIATFLWWRRRNQPPEQRIPPAGPALPPPRPAVRTNEPPSPPAAPTVAENRAAQTDSVPRVAARHQLRPADEEFDDP